MSAIVAASKNVVGTDEVATLMKQIRTKDEENARLNKKLFTMQTEFEETEKKLKAELVSGNAKLAVLRDQA